jgi:hypothetical protein
MGAHVQHSPHRSEEEGAYHPTEDNPGDDTHDQHYRIDSESLLSALSFLLSNNIRFTLFSLSFRILTPLFA